MELTPIYKRAIGLDVHQAQISACAIMEQADGSVVLERREFGGFKRDRKALAQWAHSIGPDVVVMESTGIYWKSPFSALEAVGIVAWVVNAHHVKAVPGRKTCRIPDDCIDEKRYPLFMARAVLKELIESLQSIGSKKSC